jgi:hypothetical protein
MKKQNNVISAFVSKITNSRKEDFSSKKYKNYTSLVNNFKTKIELQ